MTFEATGAWSVGSWAGGCGPGGMGGYANYSLRSDKPHGCLLIRVGDEIVSAANKSGMLPVAPPGGAVTMRCNDKKATDNSGSISVRLVVVPFSVMKK